MATDWELKGYRFYIYKSLDGNCYKYKPVDPKYYNGESWQKFQDQYGNFGIYDTEIEAFKKCCELNEIEGIINPSNVLTKLKFGVELTTKEFDLVTEALSTYDTPMQKLQGVKTNG